MLYGSSSLGGRIMRLVLTSLFASGLLFGAHAADPVGDYGDAPDDATHFFPTKYSTTHSRIPGGHGAHHTTTSLEVLGPTTASVSREAGATDPADPDGFP